MNATRLGMLVLVLAAASPGYAQKFPAGEGKKPGPEEIARLTELGKQITNLSKDEILKLEMATLPYPTEMAIGLNNGYGGADDYPKTVAGFEQLLKDMTASGYNTLYAPYKEWRIPLCRKYGVKMMIDICAWFDDSQNDIRDPRMWQRPRVKQICERVRNDRGVWGYNIWNEPIHEYYRGGGNMNEHICYLKHWDGTHPVWVGTKYSHSVGWVRGNPGCMAWYDYHWARGFAFHYGHCVAFARENELRDSMMGRWEYVGGVNTNLYTAHQSMAWGLKTLLWFIGGSWDRGKQQWNPNHNFCKASLQLMPLFEEVGKIGRPIAHRDAQGKTTQIEVFSTPEIDPATKQPKADPKSGQVKIIGNWTPFPADHWAQVASGSVVAGFFKYSNGDDAIFIASHDANKPQEVVLDFSNRSKGNAKPFTVGLFDRATRQWKDLPLEQRRVKFALGGAGGELLAVGPKLRKLPRTPEELGPPEADPLWAENALYVGYDVERTDLKKAATIYRSIAETCKEMADGKKAAVRLAWVTDQIPREEAAVSAYEKLLAESKALTAAPAADAPPKAKEAWRKQNASVIDKLQESFRALYDAHPNTMGATRARELLEKHNLRKAL